MTDFGDAAYFKSPSFDHKDEADFKGWLDYRRSKSEHAIPKAYENASKYDTKSTSSGGFAGKGSESAVVKGDRFRRSTCWTVRRVVRRSFRSIIDEFSNRHGKDGLSRKRLSLQAPSSGKELDPNNVRCGQVAQLYIRAKRRAEDGGTVGTARSSIAGKRKPV
jgi:hypothetical protein